jgi:hypothetical protein
VIVAVVIIAALAMLLLDRAHRRHQEQVNAMVAVHAADRQRDARERWDLNTRLTAPEVVRAAPPAPPADAPPLEVLQALSVVQPAPPDAPADEDDFDESFLVGTGPAEA